MIGWTPRQLAGRERGLSNRKHGGWGSPEYRIWVGIKERCCNPDSKLYPRYGGRGIVVCERWRASFEAFLADVGQRPSSDLSLDRIDNDGPYSPDNCRWADRAQQQRNKRNTRRVEWRGNLVAVSDLADQHGIHPVTLYDRIQRGWPVERAVQPPPVDRMAAVGRGS